MDMGSLLCVAHALALPGDNAGEPDRRHSSCCYMASSIPLRISHTLTGQAVKPSTIPTCIKSQ